MKLERVEFYDHFSSDDWESVESMRKADFGGMVSVSVGWVLAENDRAIRICANIDGTEDEAERCWGCFVILKSTILKRVPLEVAR